MEYENGGVKSSGNETMVDKGHNIGETEDGVNGNKGEEIGVVIMCQHEEIFNKMHRI